MKLMWIILAASFLVDPIGKINSLKSEAKAAYQSGDYQKAISSYRYLVDSLNVSEEAVKMNLANAYFNLGDTVNATSFYQQLIRSTDAQTRSNAFQQLGVLSNRSGDFQEALTNFKESLKANPQNEEARYNYEMVKKKLEEKQKQQQQQKDQQQDQKNNEKDKQQNKDKKDSEKKNQNDKEQQEQQKQDQKDQQQKNEEQKQKEQQEQEQEDGEKKEDKKDIPPSVADKLKQMEMSEEKAKMILEAMKNQEIQYLQQNKRKATKPKDKAKPDW